MLNRSGVGVEAKVIAVKSKTQATRECEEGGSILGASSGGGTVLYIRVR